MIADNNIFLLYNIKTGGFTMKKFYYIIGAVVTATAIFALIAVMLKKLRISLCIEGIDDEIIDDSADEEITLSFEDEDELFDFEPEIETETEAVEDEGEQL